MPYAPLARAAWLLLVFALPASAKELWQHSWIEVRTEHFAIQSALKEEPTRQLAIDLENFRTLAQSLTNIGRLEERIPTKVYVFPQRVAEFGFTNDIVGYFMPQMRANYAAVIPVGGGELDDVLKHEYVHFLVHNRDALSYPAWFDEGFAEVLQTLTVRPNAIEYGAPSRMRIDWLSNAPWMGFERLLETRDTSTLKGDTASMFYAQSWLLMHYLMIGRPERKFAADNSAYLMAIEAGARPADAFEHAFGIPVKKLRGILIRYGTSKMRYYRMALTKPMPEAATQVRGLPPDEIATQLGLLLLLHGELGEAKRYVEAAIALKPTNASALVVLGDLHKFAGRFDESPAFYEKAILLEPDNSQHELDYAEYFLDRAHAAQAREEIAGHLVEARRHFARSYKLNPDDPETLAMNGASYLLEGESASKAVESLAAAHDLLPSQPQIMFLLAQAYAAAGEQRKAEQLLRSLVAWSHSGSSEEAAKLLAGLGAAPLENTSREGESTPSRE